MSVHIIRVLRELSDSSPKQRPLHTSYFYNDVDSWNTGYWEPNTDIYESKDQVIFRVELAGVSKEDISIRIKNSELQIEGIRRAFESERDVHYHQVELHCGEFRKRIRLPESIIHNEVTAKFDNGILCITVSKKQQPIEIPIDDDTQRNLQE